MKLKGCFFRVERVDAERCGTPFRPDKKDSGLGIFPMKTFGERLRHVRGTVSQAAFAGTLGIPQTTLSNYERDKNEPDFALIDRICTGFRVNPEWLLFGRGPLRPDGDATIGEKRGPAEKSAPRCPRCALLECELKLERERRKITDALIESLTKNLLLLEENTRLRLEHRQAIQREDALEGGKSVERSAIRLSLAGKEQTTHSGPLPDGQATQPISFPSTPGASDFEEAGNTPPPRF